MELTNDNVGLGSRPLDDYRVVEGAVDELDVWVPGRKGLAPLLVADEQCEVVFWMSVIYLGEDGATNKALMINK